MPRFTLISAVYNVGRYLPDFLGSLDSQTVDHSEVEVVLVNDGSTDASADIIAQWKATTDYSVIVVDQANAGQSAARNAGLDHAHGTWVSFPDPDDILDSEYLASVRANLIANDQAALAAAHLVDFWEAEGEIRDSHPLRFRFRGGTQVVDLDRFPRNIHLHASSAFFRRDRVDEFGIRFDSRIKPVFEDAHFVQSYLLSSPVRSVIFDDDARYLYRRRADGTSTLQTSGIEARRYTDVLRYGLLDLLRRAAADGPVPRWLQNTVLYDLFWILRAEESLSPKTGHLPSAAADEFCALMAEISTHLDAQTIEAFDLIKVSLTQREVLLHGVSDSDWSWDFVQAEEFDEKKKLVKLRYHYTGKPPEEQVKFRGLDAEPMYAKTRAIKYLGRPLIYERILWMSARGTITMSLNGVEASIDETPPQPKKFVLRPSRSAALSAKKDALSKRKSKPRTSASDRAVAAMADSPFLRRRFSGAWVFMDRHAQAGDNAEHLFKYVRKHHRNRNAWFVLDENSPDWKRLKAEGVDRLVAHGSRTWKALCLNASLIVSSHIDVDVISPFALSDGRRPEWEHVFLQHGVIMNDLSAWLNTKRPRLVVTSTEPEHRSIVGNGSSYILSDKETAMTGLPRYDRLTELDASVSAARSSSITVMPTWRKSLGASLSMIVDPADQRAHFMESEWWKQWSELLGSPSLREAAAAEGLRIRFMPHPGFEKYLRDDDVPAHVELVRHSTHDFQTVLVESALVVTDISSVAFDAAYVDRPIVYFQFDTAATYGGGHIAKPGYFSFENDGFGPVVSTVAEAVDAIGSLISGDDPRSAEFAERRKATFTLPKTGNCERTYKAIVRSLKVVSPKDGTTLKPSPTAQPTRYLDEPSRADSALKSEPVARTASEPEPKSDTVLRATTGPVKPTVDEDPAKTAPTG